MGGKAMTARSCVAALALLAAPLAASAETPDWPASVVCSLGDATICTQEGCHEASLETLDVPRLVRLDFADGVMHAVTPQHHGRRSSFEVVERGETQLVLQGYENGRAFSAVLDDFGTLAIGAATEGTTFSVFAVCTDLALIVEATE
jgi:hypothetical protein